MASEAACQLEWAKEMARSQADPGVWSKGRRLEAQARRWGHDLVFMLV